jgi:hypothetical protein
MYDNPVKGTKGDGKNIQPLPMICLSDFLFLRPPALLVLRLTFFPGVCVSLLLFPSFAVDDVMVL